MLNMELKKYKSLVKKVNKIEDSISRLNNKELQEKTNEFKEKLNKGCSLDDIMIEAFAVVRQASYRVLKMRHYDVQIIGGMVLHNGKIAEMKTGEGKTLVATLPIYLNALTGKGVHVVTTNEYLARRDKELNQPLFEFLGLTVGVICSNMSPDEKRAEYAKDITYVTNSDLGFDYLKDNMVHNIEERVLRGLNYAIIDEVDSILIDEARTPLIISGKGDKPSALFKVVDTFVKSLTPKDYEIDLKISNANLTESGVFKAERTFNMNNYSDIEHSDLRHIISQSLKANYIFKKDDKYIVKDGEIVLIDSSTGRISEGRRYSDGLHQAIEAKEGVMIKEDNKTLATITYQNFFIMYDKLAGMSGTAKTEVDEFRYTYMLDVVEIPTNLPIARIDMSDKIFFTEEDKLKAIIKDIRECNEKGQPVLLGTESIKKSEEISKILTEHSIKHSVLNAKNHEEEAEIISLAGQKGAVTISTNMAGRGTDIKLGDGVAELGGLKVIGTYRNENRRIDNQLRGRSGRQGDTGASQFYVSLEDELIKTFMSEDKHKKILSIDYNEDDCLNDRFTTKLIENCQKKLEGIHFNYRKQTKKYDDAINAQRVHVYNSRDNLLLVEDAYSIVESMIKDIVPKFIDLRFSNIIESNSLEDFEDACKRFKKEVYAETGIELSTDILFKKSINKSLKEFKEYCVDVFIKELESKKDTPNINYIIKSTLLRILDSLWIEHLEDVSALRKSLQFAGLKQQDPLIEYITETNKLFEDFIFTLNLNATFALMRYKYQDFEKIKIDNENDLKVGVVKKRIIHNDNISYESGMVYISGINSIESDRELYADKRKSTL